ncbi:AMP-binding protein [Sulfuriroseicoccus oceanibius]|uniref:AMP-binding protein n=1 Tax=Sulfuriroseicoccus oceanibius TaxID=2707525 RepID=A0A6B3L8K4_9BACT|nr:AMP-binding protein [Sulfuriroseicoccus oceanibius]QQL44249.1 AMP-binding protein [Sulfuriroseicoccus oceanibius]
MNLTQHLTRHAAERPDQAAIIDYVSGRPRSISFGDLEQQVNGGAEALLRSGLRSGDRVVVFHPIAIELYVFLLAAMRANLAVVLIDPANGRDFVNRCVHRVMPSAFFGSGKAHLLRIGCPALRTIRRNWHSSGVVPFSKRWKPSPSNQAPTLNTPGTPPALITFTSGGTGEPKAASRTHDFLLAQHRELSTALEHEAGAVELVTLPVFTLANLASGMTSVIANTDLRHPGAADAAAIAKQCERHAITRCVASPAFFQRLIASDCWPGFQHIHTGGAPVFPPLLDAIAERGTDAWVVYGSTEAEPISDQQWSTVSKADRERITNGYGIPVGRPSAGTELRILIDQTGTPLIDLTPEELDRLTLAPGHCGEIIVSGDHVLSGYLDRHGDDLNKIHIGSTTWHRTGDAGIIDESGRLWLRGRCSALLEDKPGETDVLYPFQIEAAAHTLAPQITRCAAIDHNSQRLLIIEGTIPENLEQQLAWAKLDAIRSRPKIPVDKRHNAKIDYPRLVEVLG